MTEQDNYKTVEEANESVQARGVVEDAPTQVAMFGETPSDFIPNFDLSSNLLEDLNIAPESDSLESALGHLAHYFHSDASVLAYLIFVLLYFPCVSTFAVLVREISRTWAIISVSWATALAYVVAVFVYQGLTASLHPLSSAVWFVGIFLCMIVVDRLVASAVKNDWICFKGERSC